MKAIRHAVNFALYLVMFVLYLITEFTDWAERRLVAMAFGDRPNTLQEWAAAFLVWVALGLGIHFLF
jgi:hypothetical protein